MGRTNSESVIIMMKLCQVHFYKFISLGLFNSLWVCLFLNSL